MPMAHRKELRLDGYTLELLEALKKSGRFGSEAAIIRTAVQDFAKIELPQLRNRFARVEDAQTRTLTENVQLLDCFPSSR